MSEQRLPLDVSPNLKPLVVCACGACGEGVPRRKAWADGLHVRRCGCRRCVGSRQSSKARRREHRVADAIGGNREPMSGNLSGFDVSSGLWRVEETANETLVRGLRRWWFSKQVEKKMARINAIGGVRRAFVASWGGKPQLVVMSFEDFANSVREEAAS